MYIKGNNSSNSKLELWVLVRDLELCPQRHVWSFMWGSSVVKETELTHKTLTKCNADANALVNRLAPPFFKLSSLKVKYINTYPVLTSYLLYMYTLICSNLSSSINPQFQLTHCWQRTFRISILHLTSKTFSCVSKISIATIWHLGVMYTPNEKNLTDLYSNMDAESVFGLWTQQVEKYQIVYSSN